MRENDIQRELVRACLSQGGFGFKASTPLLKGIADLYLMLPGFMACWAEIKFHKTPTISGRYLIGLTPHQHRFIQQINAHGGYATAVVVVAAALGEYLIGVVPRDQIATVTHVVIPGNIRKQRATPWPIRKIIERIVA